MEQIEAPRSSASWGGERSLKHDHPIGLLMGSSPLPTVVSREISPHVDIGIGQPFPEQTGISPGSLRGKDERREGEGGRVQAFPFPNSLGQDVTPCASPGVPANRQIDAKEGHRLPPQYTDQPISILIPLAQSWRNPSHPSTTFMRLTRSSGRRLHAFRATHGHQGANTGRLTARIMTQETQCGQGSPSSQP